MNLEIVGSWSISTFFISIGMIHFPATISSTVIKDWFSVKATRDCFMRLATSIIHGKLSSRIKIQNKTRTELPVDHMRPLKWTSTLIARLIVEYQSIFFFVPYSALSLASKAQDNDDVLSILKLNDPTISQFDKQKGRQNQHIPSV